MIHHTKIIQSIILSMTITLGLFNTQSSAQGITCGFDVLNSIETINQITDIRFNEQNVTLSSFNVVKTYDVTDPSNPELIKDLTMPIWLSPFTFTDDLFIGFHTGRLYIYDIADTEEPKQLSKRGNIIRPNKVILYGSFLYVSEEREGVHIFDITDLTNPVLVQTLSPLADGLDIQLVGSTLYATSESNGLVMYDLSDPANPALIDSQPIAFDRNIFWFTIEDDIVYASESGRSIVTVDVSDLQNPIVLDRIDFDERFFKLDLMGDWIYVTADNERMQVIDRRDPANLMLAMSYPFQETIVTYAAGSGVILTYEQFDNLVRLYSPTGDNPIIGATPINQTLYDFKVEEPYMYQLYMNEIRILERNAQGEFEQIGDLTTNHTLVDIELVGDLAYIASYRDGVVVLDVSDKTAPSYLYTYPSLKSVSKILVDNNTIFYAGSSAGIRMINFRGPLISTEEILIPESNAGYEMELVGDFLYAAAKRDGLEIFDVNDRSNPQFVGRYDTQWDAEGIALHDQIAYLAHSSSISTIDISDKNNPELLSIIYTGGRLNEIIHHRDTLYTRTDNWILKAFSLEDPTTPKPEGELSRFRRISHAGDSLFATDYNSIPITQIIEFDISNKCIACPADFTGDDILNFFDVSLFLQLFASQDPAADLTPDGVFNFFDVSVFFQDFNAGCP